VVRFGDRRSESEIIGEFDEFCFMFSQLNPLNRLAGKKMVRQGSIEVSAGRSSSMR
jgi:hypothetical protein